MVRRVCRHLKGSLKMGTRMEKTAEALEGLRLLSLVWASRLNEGDRAVPIQHQCEAWWELDFSRCSGEGAA